MCNFRPYRNCSIYRAGADHPESPDRGRLTGVKGPHVVVKVYRCKKATQKQAGKGPAHGDKGDHTDKAAHKGVL